MTQADGTTSVVTTGFTPEDWDKAGMRLTSVDMVSNSDNTFYLAYTATQSEMAVDANRYGDRNVHMATALSMLRHLLTSCSVSLLSIMSWMAACSQRMQ